MEDGGLAGYVGTTTYRVLHATSRNLAQAVTLVMNVSANAKKQAPVIKFSTIFHPSTINLLFLKSSTCLVAKLTASKPIRRISRFDLKMLFQTVSENQGNKNTN